MARPRLGEILIKAGLLTEEALQRALGQQQRWGGPLGKVLVEMDLISEETLVRALSTQYNIPAVGLDPSKLNPEVGRMIAREICERHRLVCFRADLKGKFLDVAMADPSKLDAIDEVRVATRHNVRPHIAAPSVIDQAITSVFYGDMHVGGAIEIDEPVFEPNGRLDRLVEPPKPAAGLAVNVSSRPPRPGSAPDATEEPGGLAPRVNLSSPPGLELEAQGPGFFSSETVTPVKSPPVAPPLPRAAVPPKEAPPPPPPRFTAVTSDRIEPVEGDHIALPGPPRASSGERFHITMDAPASDKEAAQTAAQMDDALGRIEALIDRNSRVLEGLLKLLVKKGVLPVDDVRRMLGTKR